MANFRITEGKGFGFGFPNGWRVSVQFGYGNYADNYDGRDHGEDYNARNIRLGAQGSDTAECACFDDTGTMVKLPKFMFDSEYTDVVSNRSTPAQVLKLLNWAAKKKPKASA